MKTSYRIGESFQKVLENFQMNLLPHNRALYLYKYSQENLPNQCIENDTVSIIAILTNASYNRQCIVFSTLIW